MASGIITNNVRIAISCFAGGIFLGVGSLILLAFNGLAIGASAGHFANVRRRHVDSRVRQLAEYRVRAHDRVLKIRTGFAVKRQRFFEVKRDDRVPRRDLGERLDNTKGMQRARN